MKGSIIAVAATLMLGGCGLADLVAGNSPPPPVTIVSATPVKPRFAPECFTAKDPAPPAWVERDRTRDTYLDDEMRREAENKGKQLAFARAIVHRRAVCAAGLNVLAR